MFPCVKLDPFWQEELVEEADIYELSVSFLLFFYVGGQFARLRCQHGARCSNTQTAGLPVCTRARVKLATDTGINQGGGANRSINIPPGTQRWTPPPLGPVPI